MKRLRHFFGMAALAAATATAAEKPAPPKPGAPALPAARFKQVRERAQALFAVRNQPPAAPVPTENPLRTATDAAAARPRGPEPGAAPTEASPTELVVLQQAVATLRVSGTFEKDGESYFVINSKPYRVGDVVQTVVEGEATYLRVREITRNGVTLALGESEVTLKYPVRITPKPAR